MRRRRSLLRSRASKGEQHVDTDQQGHPRRHPGHHRQDRDVPHLQMPRVRQRRQLLRRRGESEKGRRKLRRHSDFRLGQGSEAADGRERLGDLCAAAGRRRRHLGGGGGRSRPGDLHHRRHSCARHGGSARPHAPREPPHRPARPELPGRDHPGRDQDRHHARPHPHEGPHRRGVALRHPDLRGGRPAQPRSAWASPRRWASAAIP